MKILTLKDQEVLTGLFKDFLQRTWQKDHVNTLLVEESMKVMTYSLDKVAVTKEQKKEVFDKSFDLVVQIAFHFLSKKQIFNPLVILASADTLFLCEVTQSSSYDAKKFSLIGKYAKKSKCFSGVFVALSAENPEKKPTLVMISIAYDESLTFKSGGDSLVEICFPKYHDDAPLELSLIEFSLKDPAISNIIENIRKPDVEIISLNSISFN